MTSAVPERAFADHGQKGPEAADSSVQLAFDGVADAGSLPRFAVGPAPALAWVLTSFRLEGFGAYLPDRVGRVPDSRAAARVRLWFAGLRACGLVQLSGGQLGFCGSVEGGTMSGRGVRLDVAQRRRILWGASGVRFAGFWPFQGRVGLRLALEAEFPWNRDYFHIQNDGPAHRPAWVVGRSFFGIEARLL
jgi:hypothetical protein